MKDTLPTEVLIGKEEGQWPLYVFVAAIQAEHWLTDEGNSPRRVWRARIRYGPEVELVQTATFLRDKESTDE